MAIEVAVKHKERPYHNVITTYPKGYVRIAYMAGNERRKGLTIGIDVFSEEADRGKGDIDEADSTKWTGKKPLYRLTMAVGPLDFQNASNDFSTVSGVYTYLKTKKLLEDSTTEVDLATGKDV